MISVKTGFFNSVNRIRREIELALDKITLGYNNNIFGKIAVYCQMSTRN